MTRQTTHSSVQPSLEDLTIRFLASRSDAAATAVELGEGDVEPHEVATGFRVDPWAAWKDATSQLTAATVPLPPDWVTLVNQPARVFSVPMAIGNFPQRIRDLHPLLKEFIPAELRPSSSQAPLPGLLGLRSWIAKNAATQPLLAAGLARLIGDFAIAESLLAQQDPLAVNERAALFWQKGRCEEALAVWSELADSPAVLFNRGMALLFLCRFAAAKNPLATASAALPETSGWKSLAMLYHSLAEIQA